MRGPRSSRAWASLSPCTTSRPSRRRSGTSRFSEVSGKRHQVASPSGPFELPLRDHVVLVNATPHYLNFLRIDMGLTLFPLERERRIQLAPLLGGMDNTATEIRWNLAVDPVLDRLVSFPPRRIGLLCRVRDCGDRQYAAGDPDRDRGVECKRSSLPHSSESSQQAFAGACTFGPHTARRAGEQDARDRVAVALGEQLKLRRAAGHPHEVKPEQRPKVASEKLPERLPGRRRELPQVVAVYRFPDDLPITGRALERDGGLTGGLGARGLSAPCGRRERSAGRRRQALSR